MAVTMLVFYFLLSEDPVGQRSPAMGFGSQQSSCGPGSPLMLQVGSQSGGTTAQGSVTACPQSLPGPAAGEVVLDYNDSGKNQGIAAALLLAGEPGFAQQSSSLVLS